MPRGPDQNTIYAPIDYHDVLSVIRELGVATVVGIKAYLEHTKPTKRVYSDRRIMARIIYLETKGLVRSMKRKHMIPHQGAMRGAWIKYVEIVDGTTVT